MEDSQLLPSGLWAVKVVQKDAYMHLSLALEGFIPCLSLGGGLFPFRVLLGLSLASWSFSGFLTSGEVPCVVEIMLILFLDDSSSGMGV